MSEILSREQIRQAAVSRITHAIIDEHGTELYTVEDLAITAERLAEWGEQMIELCGGCGSCKRADCSGRDFEQWLRGAELHRAQCSIRIFGDR